MDNNQPQSGMPQMPAPAQMSNDTIMGILAYIGPLVVVSYLMGKDDPFVKFHIKQGLVLLVIEIIIWVLTSFFWIIFWRLYFLIELVDLVVIVLAIIGIVNVVQKKEKMLPLVGSFGNSFNI